VLLLWYYLIYLFRKERIVKFAFALVILIVVFVVVVSTYAKSLPLAVKDKNMDIVRLSFTAFNEADWPAFSDLHSPTYVQHVPGLMDPISWGEYILTCTVAHKRFPGLKYRIDDSFAYSDRVAVLTTWEYRNDSDQFIQQFPDGVVLGSKVGIFQLRDGKIIEEWCGCDPIIMQRFISVGDTFASMR